MTITVDGLTFEAVPDEHAIRVVNEADADDPAAGVLIPLATAQRVYEQHFAELIRAAGGAA